jgi:hypothetical protein
VFGCHYSDLSALGRIELNPLTVAALVIADVNSSGSLGIVVGWVLIVSCLIKVFDVPVTYGMLLSLGCFAMIIKYSLALWFNTHIPSSIVMHIGIAIICL